MPVTDPLIGTGLAFPMAVDHDGGISTVSGDQLIDQSIRLILSTAPGERVMRPEFGCKAWDLVYGSSRPTMMEELSRAVTEALVRWEPRIDVLEVEAEADPSHAERVLVEVEYSVKATNDRRNLVYPFYVIPHRGER